MVGLGALVRLIKFLQDRSFWVDEAMIAFNLGRRSFAGLLALLEFNQLAPFPWLWLEKALFLIGGMDELLLRTPALIAGMLLPWLVWRAGVRLIGPHAALVAVALTSTGAALLFYSVELKPYTIDAAMTALLLLMTGRWLEQAPTERRLRGIGALGVGAVLASFPAVITLGAVGVMLLVQAAGERNIRRTGAIAGWGVLWLLAFALPQLLLYRVAGEGVAMQTFWAPALARLGDPGLLTRASAAANALQSTVLDVQAWPGSELFLMAMAVGAWCVLRRHGVLALLVVAGPLALLALAWTLDQIPANQRLFLFAAPCVAMLLGAALVGMIDLVPRTLRRGAGALAAMLVTVVVVHEGRAGLARQKPSGGRQLILRVMEEPAAPVWLNHGGVPVWLVYSENWEAPDSARLDWYAAGRRRDRWTVGDQPTIAVDTAGLRVWRGHARWERIAGPNGLTAVAAGEIDAGVLGEWAAAEADNLMPWLSQRPWLLLNHERVGERAVLLRALADRGILIDSIDATKRGSLWRLRPLADVGQRPRAEITSSTLLQR